MWNGTNITEELPPKATPGSALESLVGLAGGGCFTCPDFGVRAVQSTSRTMCEFRAGYTDEGSYRGSASVVNLTVLTDMVAQNDNAAALLQFSMDEAPLPSPPNLYTQLPPSAIMMDRRRRSRRLLLLPTGQQPEARMVLSEADAAIAARAGGRGPQLVVQEVPMARLPALVGSDHFTCCDGAWVDQGLAAENCRRLRGAAYHGLNTLSGSALRSPCGSAAPPKQQRQRRLLQQQQPPGSEEAVVRAWLANRTGTPPPSACYAGTFKPTSGDGPCYFCPDGASTTGPAYAGASLANQCACLPGFYSERAALLDTAAPPPNSSSAATDESDAEAAAAAAAAVVVVQQRRLLLRCMPCPNGTYRDQLQLNDSVCHPCPPRRYTPGPGSAFCYCVPGTYPNTTYEACATCEAGFYCDGNAKTPCPDQSGSAPGAGARGECVCNPSTHYGDLSRDGGVCLLRPPGYVCQNSTTTGGGGAGAIGCGCAAGWTTTATATAATVRCTSPCVAGQFAALQPRSQNLRACVPCPPDTYAEDGALVGACAPCPLGRGTQGLEVSGCACVCVFGLLPSSSSSPVRVCVCLVCSSSSS